MRRANTETPVAWKGTTPVQYNITSDERLKDWSVEPRDYRAAIKAIWVGDFVWKEAGSSGFGVRARRV
jgi:hypothetical protein